MRRKMEETFKGQMCRENKKMLLWGYRDVEAKRVITEKSPFSEHRKHHCELNCDCGPLLSLLVQLLLPA